MKVNSTPIIPHAVPLDDTVEADFSFEKSMSIELISRRFQYIQAGEERMYVILKADGYTNDEIAWMAGVNKQRVERVILRVRKKLITAGVGP